MHISTPGRICLFGEHQDYLGLPVIAMAITLRAELRGEKRSDQKVVVHKPDIGETEIFSLNDLAYQKPRDYFKSGIIVSKKAGFTFSTGFECEITSDIPISAGTSSSSAITVSWIHFLSQMADEPVHLSKQKIGSLSYQTEVSEFNEPGGMMDQYTTAMGKLIYLDPEPEISIRPMGADLGTFVLGDSCEPKNTMEILNRCRDSRLKVIQQLKIRNPNLSIRTCQENLNQSDLDPDEKDLFSATIKNRDLLQDALLEFEKPSMDHKKIGQYLTKHHSVLRDVLQISTPRIESMMDAAKNAGALGGKINGSGGGGCMFAYAPDDPQTVAESIESVGGKSYIIHSDEGTKVLI